jgi:predicted amidohydrolase
MSQCSFRLTSRLYFPLEYSFGGNSYVIKPNTTQVHQATSNLNTLFLSRGVAAYDIKNNKLLNNSSTFYMAQGCNNSYVLFEPIQTY